MPVFMAWGGWHAWATALGYGQARPRWEPVRRHELLWAVMEARNMRRELRDTPATA